MKIQEGLVYDERTGTLVGFAHDSQELATHVLTWQVCGIDPEYKIKFTLGFFGTKNLTAHEIYPQFWDAVCALEKVCGLKVEIFKKMIRVKNI